MPFFGMAREKVPVLSPAESIPPPLARPGTSGTENLLMTNRRQASQQFQKAQRAERAYRAKKRATAARQGFNDARGHFSESLSHFKQGVKMLFRVVKSVPYIYGEKREQQRREADQKRKMRALAKKKKLEEKLAREGADADAEDASGTTEAESS